MDILVLVILSCFMISSILSAGVGWWWWVRRRRGKQNTKPKSGDSGGSSGSVEGIALDNGESGKTAITFYGDKPTQSRGADDNGIGVTGVNLDAHAKVGLKFNGKPVYAGAVHQYAGPKYLYKVLEMGGDVNPMYIHVVDICDAKDSVCNKNVKAHGNNFLVDIYRTGWATAGKSDGVLQGTYKVVGEIPYTKIPKAAWKERYIMPSCTGKCAEKERKWIKRP